MKHLESKNLKKSFDFLNLAIEDLKKYEALLLKWQLKVNLISSKTIEEIWDRHILDSAQLYFYLPKNAGSLIDLGSGAGFPGIVLALLNKKLKGPLKKIILIESDLKKSIFLEEAARILDLNINVVNKRIEQVNNIKADVITARALAPLEKLTAYAFPLLNKDGECLFLKGSQVDQEISEIKDDVEIQKYKSMLNAEGCIVKIKERKK
ncbi:MAG: 16S rRNA (guanine(527)-N(7))-methyltransferase RsmG [Lactobacillales bacterium]|jgi:16S rRNA (guanine527-N7)-methyltransferase|nr:16S rRNA (guanine(527)-N(7))-methyltransferase RsmG [Lactobacillales bacterium]